MPAVRRAAKELAQTGEQYKWTYARNFLLALTASALTAVGADNGVDAQQRLRQRTVDPLLLKSVQVIDRQGAKFPSWSGAGKVWAELQLPVPAT